MLQSEDVQAFQEIMQRCPVFFEVNGDLSHYIYRGIWQGAALEEILSRVGHLHQRMAREHGDMSADIPPAKGPGPRIGRTRVARRGWRGA